MATNLDFFDEVLIWEMRTLVKNYLQVYPSACVFLNRPMEEILDCVLQMFSPPNHLELKEILANAVDAIVYIEDFNDQSVSHQYGHSKARSLFLGEDNGRLYLLYPAKCQRCDARQNLKLLGCGHMWCEQCMKRNPATSKFCPGCDYRLTEEELVAIFGKKAGKKAPQTTSCKKCRKSPCKCKK